MTLFPGAGTVLNVVTVLVGAGLGLVLGARMPERTRAALLAGLGLVTLLFAATSAAAVADPVLAAAVGAPTLVVLAAVVLGGLAGSLLGLEERLERLAGAVARTTTRGGGRGDGATAEGARARAADGFLTASLVFCVGPLTVLGSLADGLGRGIDQLALKACLDGVAAVAFAASLGPGVAASAVTVAVVQGALTLVGAVVGDVLPEPHVLALTATGGLLLVGTGLRLLGVARVPVADLLPALVAAPLVVQVVVALR